MLKKIILLLIFSLFMISCNKENKEENIDNWAEISINDVEKKWIWDTWNSSSTKVEKGFKN